jgi:hypothetical protein
MLKVEVIEEMQTNNQCSSCEEKHQAKCQSVFTRRKTIDAN